MKNKKFNIQSLIIIGIISILIIYMIVDFFIATPKLKAEVKQVNIEYQKLGKYLNEKIPEIDSTLKNQSTKLIQQTNEIYELKEEISKP
ncbi:MAG: hypothetical protein PHF86_02015 [Candidatus Nanoarchaeia archaeon]|nr:hypothetical protein [Candidatus Nanoarchaeia archaeon]